MRPAEARSSADESSIWTAPIDALDRVLVFACSAASIAAGLVLTYSIVVRHLFHWSTDWQDEASVFLLVGATFLSAPYVQSRRGHLGIEAIRGLLPAGLERVRLVLVDVICLAFSGSFTWLCWALFLDAAESGEVTDSTWAPPLWLPYGLMTAGMTLLTLRFLAQSLSGCARLAARPR